MIGRAGAVCPTMISSPVCPHSPHPTKPARSRDAYPRVRVGIPRGGAREMWQMDWFSYALGALWAFAAFSYGRWLGNKEEKKLLAPVVIRLSKIWNEEIQKLAEEVVK